MARVLGWGLWAPCASWPVRGEDNYRGPWNASTPNPILVIGTTGDPQPPTPTRFTPRNCLETPSCSPTRATVT